MPDVPKDTRHIEVWRGEYRGVTWEINRLVDWYGGYHGEPRQEGWTFYLCLHRRQFTDEQWFSLWLPPQETSDLFRDLVSYAYESAPIISDIEWHCGPTFYEKRDDRDANRQSIKVGCDYHHYGDERMTYNWNWLYRDVLQAIESLWSAVPNLRCWCSYNGKYYDVSEGAFDEGMLRFTSNEGKAEGDVQRAKWEAEKRAKEAEGASNA